MTSRTALITGVAGQDGVLLARHLLASGYRVIGTRQPGSPFRLSPYLRGVTVVEHDLVDTDGFARLVGQRAPAEVYNLAGLSSVGRSWEQPELVHEVNAASVERMLDILVSAPTPPRFFQASSSEVFGTAPANPQDENTPHRPANPYAESKSRAHASTGAAREAGLFASVGILYNHESPLRSTAFVTRKITRAVAEIAAGRRDVVELGNLDVSRDWGAAREYVAAMHAALQHHEPGDYVIATGRAHTLRELVEAAFDAAGVADPWSHIQQNPDLSRRADSPARVGNPAHVGDVLGWRATVPFTELIHEMVRADQQRLATGIEESPDYLEVTNGRVNTGLPPVP
jgi:GDPmannose 4,6-dehydratase